MIALQQKLLDNQAAQLADQAAQLANQAEVIQLQTERIDVLERLLAEQDKHIAHLQDH